MVLVGTVCGSAVAKLVTCHGDAESDGDYGAVDEIEHHIFGHLVGWVSIYCLPNGWKGNWGLMSSYPGRFFALFQSGLNALAELLQFGDREFYTEYV